jgi:hypothetical protein
VFTRGLKKGIEHLVIPTLLSKQLVVDQPHLSWVLASDVSSAENDVPNEKQIAKVAFVVTNAVFVGNGVVCPVRCGCGKGAL